MGTTRYDQDVAQSDIERLTRLCEAALIRLRQASPSRQDVERLADEIRLIEERGLAAQFLAVGDAVRGIRQRGVLVGPGRGSSAGSLVCLLLGVTAVDPLANGLWFERLVGSGKRSLDIDIDVAESALEYVSVPKEVTTCGRLHTAHVIETQDLVIDVLGLQTLDRIARTIAIVEPGADPNEYASRIALDDEPTFALLSSGRDFDIFQFASQGVRASLARTGSRALEDLAALVALYRPGTLGTLEEYVERPSDAPHGSGITQITEAARSSRGLLIYQEQIMQLAVSVGGLSGSEADALRKAFGKRDVESTERMHPKFLDGAQSLGLPTRVVTEVWEAMSEAAEYAFCRAHAVAYATVAYWDAYLQAHFPEARSAVRIRMAQGGRDATVGPSKLRMLASAERVFYETIGRFGEYRQSAAAAEHWLDVARHTLPQKDSGLLPPLLQASYYLEYDDPKRSRALLREALSIAESNPSADPKHRMRAVISLAHAYGREGQNDRRIQFTEEWVRLVEASNPDPLAHAHARLRLAEELCESGDFDQGIRYAEDLLPSLNGLVEDADSQEARSKAESRLKEGIALLADAYAATARYDDEAIMRRQMVDRDWHVLSIVVRSSDCWTDSSGWQRLAVARFLSGDRDGAVAAQQQALKYIDKCEDQYRMIGAMRKRDAAFILELLSEHRE